MTFKHRERSSREVQRGCGAKYKSSAKLDSWISLAGRGGRQQGRAAQSSRQLHCSSKIIFSLLWSLWGSSNLPVFCSLAQMESYLSTYLSPFHSLQPILPFNIRVPCCVHIFPNKCRRLAGIGEILNDRGSLCFFTYKWIVKDHIAHTRKELFGIKNMSVRTWWRLKEFLEEKWANLWYKVKKGKGLEYMKESNTKYRSKRTKDLSDSNFLNEQREWKKGNHLKHCERKYLC